MTRVLVTRPKGQNEALAAALRERGYAVDVLPMLAIEPFEEAAHPQQCARIRSRIAALGDYHHMIFISTNAVAAAWPWIERQWPTLPAHLQYYAIGKATSAALADCGIRARQGGPAMNSEALLKLPALNAVDGQRVLICRGEGGRDYLRHMLEQRGAIVDYCNLYQRRAQRYQPGTLAALLEKNTDFLVLNSTETIQALHEQAIIDNVRQQLQDVAVIAPGQRVARYATECGFHRVICAENAGPDAIMDALDKANNSKGMMS